MLLRLHANRALVLLLKGDLPAALAVNDVAGEVLSDYHDTYLRIHHLADRGEILVESGDWDDAMAALVPVIEAAEREGWPPMSTRAHAILAVPLIARARFDEARDHLERCLAAATRPGFGDEVPLIMALVRRAALHRTLGDLDAAANDLQRAQFAAERLGRPQESADVHLGASRLFALRGDAQRAEEHARAALTRATTHGFGLYQGRARVALAGALAESDRDAALVILDEAIATLRACDARPDLATALTLYAEIAPIGPEARRVHAEALALRRRLGIL